MSCIHYGAGYVSSCCGAPIDPDIVICQSCKEHSEAIPDEEDE